MALREDEIPLCTVLRWFSRQNEVNVFSARNFPSP